MDAVPRPLLSALLAGERRAIARAASAIENGAAESGRLCEQLAEHLGRAHVIGLTGAPGAGKSTLLDALVGVLIARGKRVAVLAVDPSSPVSGGALLGDRIRMAKHGPHESVFIRSLASRGHVGGLSRTAGRLVDLFDAAGFDVVIVETVGAGQSEIDIGRIADSTLVLCPPGLGDDVQAMKAGILEIADVLVVSKADLPAAERTARELQAMLELRCAAPGQWKVPVLRTAAPSAEGVAALADALEAHARHAGVGQRVDRAGGADPSSRRLAALAARDPFAASLGMQFVCGGAGRAAVRLVVGEQHLSFNGTCHGGVVFSLADMAFGLASNSHGTLAAGIDAHITYQVAVQPGDVLTATAIEVSRSRRLAVYRVDVARADGTLTSTFTGTVYRSGKTAPSS